jgi:hypothetical protein
MVPISLMCGVAAQVVPAKEPGLDSEFGMGVHVTVVAARRLASP